MKRWSVSCSVPYYTKAEIDEKLENIDISGDCISSGDVQNMIDASVEPIEGSVEALSGTVGELSTDMENKADRSEIPSLENYYNKTEVNAIADTKLDASAYTPTDLSGYATQQWVNNKGYLTSGYLKRIKETSGSHTVSLSKTSTRDENIVFGGDVDAKLGGNNYNKIIMRCLLPIKGESIIYTDEVTGRDSVNGLMTTRENYAIGQWNERDDGWEGSENYFSIGDGTSDSNRHNIFTILKDGRIKLSDGLYLQEWMDYIDNNYATQEWVNNQGYLTEHQPLKTINNQSLIGEGNITISGGGSADLSNYYNKPEVNNLLSNKANASDLSALNTTVEQLSTSLENKADKSEIPSLAGYATQQWVENKHYLTEHQSLNGYATQEWVGNQGYLTEHQTLKTINNQSIVGEGNITITAETPDLSNYYTKTEADNTFAEQELLDIVNNRVNTHTGNTNIHVTATEKTTWNNKVDSSTLNNYMLKTQIWCGTQAEYDAITTKDNEVIYLIHA